MSISDLVTIALDRLWKLVEVNLWLNNVNYMAVYDEQINDVVEYTVKELSDRKFKCFHQASG